MAKTQLDMLIVNLKMNLPTSELQNTCWGCLGEQLQASASCCTRQTHRMARVTKHLFIVLVISENYAF